MKNKNTFILSLILTSLLLVGCNTNSSSSDSNQSSESSSSESSSQSSSSSSQSGTDNPNPENPSAIVKTVEQLAQMKATDTKNIYRVTGTAQYPGYAKKRLF